jgi:hypothetical protein
MSKQKIKTDELDVGDLVFYYPVTSLETTLKDPIVKPKIAIIIKVKKLLKLYDILVQVDNVVLKDVNKEWLVKAT